MDERPDPKRREPEGLSPLARAMYAAEPYMRASWSLAAGVGLGVLAGYYADEWLHTKPWLLIVGSVLGMGLGVFAFIKAILEAGKR